MLAIDALAARDLSRLGRTVQIADCGIAPAPAWATTGLNSPGTPWGFRWCPWAFPLWWTAAPSSTTWACLPRLASPRAWWSPPGTWICSSTGAPISSAWAVNHAAQPELTPEEIAYLIA